MTQVPVDLVSCGESEIEVRLRLDLDAAPFSDRRVELEAALQVLREREGQLTAALDELSQRLGRAQAELNERNAAYELLEDAYRKRHVELEGRCQDLLEQREVLIAALEQVRAQNGTPAAPEPPSATALDGARTGIAPASTPFGGAITGLHAAPEAPTATQTVAGPPELLTAECVEEVPVILEHRIDTVARPAESMATPRSTWTRHPTVDVPEDEIHLRGPIGRLFDRVQLFIGLTPRFARVDSAGYAGWDDVPDDWDRDAGGLARPWYRRPLAWVVVLAVAASVGLFLASNDVSPRIVQALDGPQELPSYLK